MGRKLEIDWQETTPELKKRYRKERNSERQARLQAFWQLRLGKTMKEVAELVGIGYRTLQDWVSWYRHRGKAMGEVGLERIFLLPYSPELNPCERVFEWLRAKIEGEVYISLEHKRCVIEQHLRRLSREKIGLE